MLAAAVAGFAVRLSGLTGLLLAAAFAPAVLRAILAAAALTPKLPRLALVGARETLYALWFSGFLVVAVRRLS